jgi:hypothetical protein
VETVGSNVDEVIVLEVAVGGAIDEDKKVERWGINNSSKRLTIVISKTEFTGSFPIRR